MFNRKSFKPNSNSGLSLPELMHFKINVKISAQPHTTTEIQSRSPKDNLF